MRRSLFRMECALVLGVVAMIGTTTMAAPQGRETLSSFHRARGGTVIVYDDDVFWDPVWGWYGPSYGPGPYRSERADSRAHMGLVPVELHVRPWKASVIVDQSVLGQARDYNDDTHPLWLIPGEHLVELQYPGYQTLRFELDVKKGLPRDLHYRLTKGNGLDPRS